MPKNAWSRADLDRLARARDLYERQWALVRAIEFPDRTRDSISAALRRVPEKAGPGGAPLLAERDPGQAAARVAEYLASVPKTRLRMPAALADYAPGGRADPQVIRLERKLLVAEDRVRALEAKLKQSLRSEDLFLRLAEVVREAAVPLPAVEFDPPLPKEHAAGGKVDAVLLLSDEHADEVVDQTQAWGLERYDFNVFRARLARLAAVITGYVRDYLPAHEIERLWVFSLGDKVNGSIHGLELRNHFQNTMRAAIAVGDAEAEFIQALLPLFPGGVHWVGVSGNHPRQTSRKDYNGPRDNFDYLVSVQVHSRLRKEIELGRCSVVAPDSWTAFVDVRGHLFALNHGDDVKGFAGIPWYGFDRKNQKVQAMLSQVNRRVAYFCYGHYHSALEFPTAGARSLHNGAFTFTSTYALNALAAGNPPQQNFYLVGEERGIILEVPIYLRDQDAEDAMRAGTWEPPFGRHSTLDALTPPLAEGFDVITRK